MKISKKLIIVLIVAAVAAYLLWKKGFFSGGKVVGGNSATNAPATEPMAAELDEYTIIDRLTGVPAAHKQYLKNYCNYLNGSLTAKANVESKAINNGISYAKQAVMDASYVTYLQPNESGVWVEKYSGARNDHNAIVAQVQAM